MADQRSPSSLDKPLQHWHHRSQALNGCGPNLAGLDGKAWAGLLFTAITSLLILIYFHNRFWLPRDDGYYAHIAERVLNGEVLNRDVQALHTGYVYLANTLALWLFGHDLISLRYPLVFGGVLQAVLAYLILLPRGRAIAIICGLAITSLSVVQFFSPTAHWYCAPLFFVLVVAMGCGYQRRWRLEIVGALIATMFLFRQLTGVFVSMGVLTYLLIHAAVPPEQRSGTAVARALLIILSAGLVFYLASKADLVGWAFFGAWPLALMLGAWRRVTIGNRATLVLLGRLAVGAIAAAVPLLAYHVLTGSVSDWISDSFIDAVALSGFEYQKAARYGRFLFEALVQLFNPHSVGTFLNSLYWPVLLLSPALVGAVTLSRLWRTRGGESLPGPLPFLAVFYGLVAVHYQDPAYLYFVAAPTFAGLLWYAGGLGPGYRRAFVGLACLQAGIGLYYHAGQPISRSYAEVISGTRYGLVRSSDPALASLHLTAGDKKTYEAILGIIDRHSEPGDPILAVPADAELFFLRDRRNPLKYSFLPFGLRDERTVAQALDVLTRTPPRLVFHVPSLPYNTRETDRIMAFVRAHYTHLGSIREYEIYALKRDP
jgi:hypothetical protein